MKKSLLALAVLGTFAGTAAAQANPSQAALDAAARAAQSSVQIFGLLDQSIGKTIGSSNKEVMDSSYNSRIGFRGYEALGGGWGAFFGFEHRFTPDTGSGDFSGLNPNASGATNIFWNGYSVVGLRHNQFGSVSVGRQYTAAFTTVQNVIDPFYGESVAALRNIGGGFGVAGVTTGPARARVANSIKYIGTFGPVMVAGDVAESTGIAGGSKPYSLAVAGTFGPAWLGVSYENPESANDELFNFGGRVTFGPATLSAMYTMGTQPTNLDISGLLIGAKVTVGAGDIKVGYATRKSDTLLPIVGVREVTNSAKFGLGYDHNLSKRTKVYVNFANDSKRTTEKNGYEVGMQHKF